jgi:hypothetical protein
MAISVLDYFFCPAASAMMCEGQRATKTCNAGRENCRKCTGIAGQSAGFDVWYMPVHFFKSFPLFSPFR